MKKALCILLTLALLLMAVPAVFAAEPKITDSLQAQMDAAAEDAKIETHIWLNCAVDKDEAYRLAVKECGYIGGLPLNMTLDEALDKLIQKATIKPQSPSVDINKLNL